LTGKVKATPLILLFFLLMILVTFTGGKAYGQLVHLGGSVGTAGSSMLDMRGAMAYGWNPANLAGTGYPRFSALALSGGGMAGNNSFSYLFAARTFQEGKWITDGEKEQIMDKLSRYNLLAYTVASVPLAGISVNNYAFNANFHSEGMISLPRDVVDFLLYGSLADKMYDFTKVQAELSNYYSFGVSTAFDVPPPDYLDLLSVGFTFKFLSGVYFKGLIQSDGHILTSQSHLDAKGDFILAESRYGQGMAMDIGIRGENRALKMAYGITLGNILGSLQWANMDYHLYHADYPNSFRLQDALTYGYWDQFSYEEIYRGNSIKRRLPSYILMATRKEFPEYKLVGYGSYYQGLNDVAGHSQMPRLSVGGEYQKYESYPLRAGIALGGLERYSLSIGAGFKSDYFRCDVGWAWNMGIMGWSNGFSIGITNYFEAPPPPDFWERLRRKIESEHINKWDN